MAKNSVPEWDTTAGNDTDIAGINIDEGMAPSGVNNAMRAMMAQIATFTRRGSDLPTAATLDLDSVDTMILDLTGSVTVTAVTLTSGHWRICRANAAFQMTASASLIINGSSTINYTAKAGELLLFEGYGSSVVRVWQIGGPLTVGVRTITGNDSITVADLGKTILLNSASAATVTFSAVATLGDGFWCKFKNIGAGAITFDPNSSETIDGQTTSIVPTNDCGEIHCTGSALYTLDRPPVITLTSATVSAGPVAIPLAAYISNGFSKFKLFVRRARPNTDGAYIVLDVSVNAGSSYVNSGYHTPGLAFNAAGVSGQLTTDQTTFVIADITGNVSGEEAYTAVEFEITSADFIMRAAGENRTTAGDNRGFNYNGHQPTGSVNQIRFNFNTGGIASAAYELVGIR